MTDESSTAPPGQAVQTTSPQNVLTPYGILGVPLQNQHLPSNHAFIDAGTAQNSGSHDWAHGTYNAHGHTGQHMDSPPGRRGIPPHHRGCTIPHGVVNNRRYH